MTSVHADVGEVLIDEDLLRARVVELGAEVSEDYEGRDLLLVGVLKGAIFFISDLMRELTVPCEVDFMAISSYCAATDSSAIFSSRRAWARCRASSTFAASSSSARMAMSVRISTRSPVTTTRPSPTASRISPPSVVTLS